MRTSRCACGAPVSAEQMDPFPLVNLHVRSEPHRSWSDRTSLFPRSTELDSTAPFVPVDLSGYDSVRPVRLRRPGHRRHHILGRGIA